ncbi:OLC1v1006619C1 [Oldenlandia corymbosa var. corymbosa]|uniref:OLC1v1006619C1 n=1 Tax=Oldenlandia corymbosa var. corymbosa TaxID=529605 RepID=A0AAV1DJV4_OLDCO|nr:OLC1v1006619C1 [Oldenlandia corymbosa var. corymbosa]
MAEEIVKNGDAVEEVVKEVKLSATVKPRLYLEAPKANDAVQFFKAAFGAEEVNRVVYPKRKADQEFPLLLSAELKLGSSAFLVSDFVADDSACPVKAVTTGFVFSMETEDVDAAVEKAVKAGATSEGVTELGCGTRMAKVQDPYGNTWLVSPFAAPAAKESTEAAEA